jgi:hypothetical protein
MLLRVSVWTLTALSVVLVALSWLVDGAPGKAAASAGIACASLVIIAFIWDRTAHQSGGQR